MVYMHLLRPICLTLLLGVICTAQVRSDNPRGRARAAEARAAGMVDVIVSTMAPLARNNAGESGLGEAPV